MLIAQDFAWEARFRCIQIQITHLDNPYQLVGISPKIGQSDDPNTIKIKQGSKTTIFCS